MSDINSNEYFNADPGGLLDGIQTIDSILDYLADEASFWYQEKADAVATTFAKSWHAWVRTIEEVTGKPIDIDYGE